MKIERPIFIIGVGRSGSSVFHRVMSEHPRVAWLSTGVASRYPNQPALNGLLMRLIDAPLIGAYLRKETTPGESYAFWDYYYRGFGNPCRDLLPGDVTHRAKKEIRGALLKALTRKRNRLLIKITGWSRIGFLREIFPDARFIHVLRDGRAVANSLVNVRWWGGWRGPENWRWGDLSPSLKQEWEKHHKSFIALAAIEWKILMDALEDAKRFVDSKADFLEVKYEEFCSSPVDVFRDTVEFCDLDWFSGFEKSVTKHTLVNTNYKWQTELTTDQQRIIECVLGDHLERYGYT